MRTFDIPKEAEEKFQLADHLNERAKVLREEGLNTVREHNNKFQREMEDKMLNRTQCLEYLPIGTLESLKNWERRYRPYGYLRFEDNKILRSQLLEFIDDKNSGKIARMIRKKG